MAKKTKTIAYGSVKAYAQVKDRLNEFRSENINGLIETTPTITDTHIIFKARILKDKSDPASAEATGHSFGTVSGNDKAKVFEKQETIAIGRALAILGYGADGEIASSEEMEEFEAHKKQVHEDALMQFTERIEDAQTIDELKELWATIGAVYHAELKPLFTSRKEKIDAKAKPKTKQRGVAPVAEGEDNGDTSEGLDSETGDGA